MKTAAHSDTAPLPMSLATALGHVDRVFGIERLLALEGLDVVTPYYIQSAPAYRRVHSREGAMHMALCPGGVFTPDGYLAQLRAVEDQLGTARATHLLELGCGMGFNARKLAQRHPDLSVTGLDLVARNLALARRQAQRLPNLQFMQGNFEDPGAGPAAGAVDLAFAVETLCHASSPSAVAANLERWLRPGGRVVIFDGHRRPGFDAVPAEVILAARLFEITTAVTRGFWRTDDWERALGAAGLVPAARADLTTQTHACLFRLQARAVRFFCSWRARMLPLVLPRFLLGNAVAGLLAPYAVGADNPGQGALMYSMLIAEKPR